MPKASNVRKNWYKEVEINGKTELVCKFCEWVGNKDHATRLRGHIDGTDKAVKMCASAEATSIRARMARDKAEEERSKNPKALNLCDSDDDVEARIATRYAADFSTQFRALRLQHRDFSTEVSAYRFQHTDLST